MRSINRLSLTLILIFSACSYSNPGASLTIAIAPDTLDPDLLQATVLPAFTKQTGIQVNLITNVTYTRFISDTQLHADLYLLPEILLPQAVRDGRVKPLPWDQIPHSELVPQAIHGFGVASCGYATMMAYNVNAYGERFPQDWQHFFAIDLTPDMRTLKRTPVDNLEFALLASGVSANNLYPLQVDQAFRQLDKIRQYVRLWWVNDQEPVQALNSGTVTMGSVSLDAILKLGSQAGLDVNRNQAIMHWNYWVIPQYGSNNPEAALRFINLVLDARTQADIVDWWLHKAPKSSIRGCSPSNQATFTLMDRGTARVFPTYPANYSLLIHPDIEWWSENYAAVSSRFENWMKK
jgi:putative spermidine/putrescine transport system substrate-binding protein